MDAKTDFFLCGAPRAGTTSLYQWLNQHPGTFLPTLKEPQFFAGDLTVRSQRPVRIESTTDYAELYHGANPNQRSGDGSTWYFLSPEAPRRIREHNPNANLIFILRDPADLVFSWHGLLLGHGGESLPFDEALQAQTDRRAGKYLPERLIPLEGLFYEDLGKYATILKRFYAQFEPDQVLVLFYEDLQSEPEELYRRVLRFLDLDDGFVPNFSIENERPNQREGWLKRWLNQPPAFIRRPLRRIVTPSIRTRLYQILWNANQSHTEKPTMPATIRAQLRQTWAKEIEELELMTGRDLSSWR
ncbi:MAG: sulfotransferase [Verrucomicrobiota bacterium]